MRSYLGKILLIAIFATALVSCKAVSNFIHDDGVIAKAGSHKLYRSDIEDLVPLGVSSEDSIAIVKDYIQTWIGEQALMDAADETLSKEEKDVSKELEEYRIALIKYRYEQKRVNERLDTVISRQEIQRYFDEHKDRFVLDVPIVKARQLVIMKDSPNLETIRQNMSSSKEEDMLVADSLAYSSALKYSSWEGKWTSMTDVAQEYGSDYKSLLSSMKNSYMEAEDETGRVVITYISEMMKAGETAPVEFCSELIRDIIISGRKHQLLLTLEQELLEDAKAKANIVIY